MKKLRVVSFVRVNPNNRFQVFMKEHKSPREGMKHLDTMNTWVQGNKELAQAVGII